MTPLTGRWLVVCGLPKQNNSLWCHMHKVVGYHAIHVTGGTEA